MNSLSLEACAHEILEVVPLVMRTIRAEMREHGAVEISVPQFRALAYVNSQPGASLSDVAERIGLTLPSASVLIDRLVERKLIARVPHTADRRRIQLTLTPRGQSVLEAARDAAQARLAEKLNTLPAADRAIVTQAMQVLRPLFESDVPGEPMR